MIKSRTKWLFARVDTFVGEDISALDECLVAESEKKTR